MKLVAVQEGMESGSDTDFDERKIENMKMESDEENGNEILETECVELDDKWNSWPFADKIWSK